MSAWHKYKAVASGGKHSKLEAAVEQMLFLREKAKEISDIRSQVTVYLTKAEVVYKPDFQFVMNATGVVWFCEAKGFQTPEWRIKRRLWTVYGPGPLEIWTGHWRRPALTETIVPRGRE